MDEENVVPALLVAELAQRLEEGKTLDIPDGATDLGDDNIDVRGCDARDAILDLVGDMGNHLHRLAEVISATFPLNHRRVNLAGGVVGVSREISVGKSLVVPEIQVGLGAITGDVDLAMLERAHRPGVDVDVRIELLYRDLEPVALQQSPDRRAREPLAETRNHPASHEYVLRHLSQPHPPDGRGNPPLPATAERNCSTNLR